MTSATEARSFWNDHAGELVSLYELMQALETNVLAGLFSVLGRAQTVCKAQPPQKTASADERANFETMVCAPAELICLQAGLKQSGAAVARLRAKLSKPANYQRLYDAFEEFHRQIQTEMQECRIFIVPKGLAADFESRAPFGAAVYDAFPSARDEIREALNCYILDRHTAAVFHAMRALEWALKALAQSPEVGVPWKQESWGLVIDQIEHKIGSCTLLKSGPVDLM